MKPTKRTPSAEIIRQFALLPTDFILDGSKANPSKPNELRKINKLDNNASVFPGQALKVPVKS